jgi:predicted ATPase/signal transduction histidine kinase
MMTFSLNWTMAELSAYSLSALRSDAEFILSRGRAHSSSHILVLSPASPEPGHEILRRLEREHVLGSELDRDWAAKPVALVRDKRRVALVLEDPGGELLGGLLDRPLPISEFLRLAVGLAGAVRRLHERGFIHKDIRPDNIFVHQESGKVWLTGFGIASHRSLEHQAPESRETSAGMLAYMAPERTGRVNRTVDSRTDLYSLGITLYQMLTGALPFTVSDPLDWVHCHIARQPPSPGAKREGVPDRLSAIVLKLLAKTAEERYQTAAGLEADLRRCQKDWEMLGRIEPFALGNHDRWERPLLPERLYGRSREIEALLDAYRRVVASGTPEILLVSGYSGIGKSSVVHHLRKGVAESGGIFLSGKFDLHKRDIPYSTFAQALQTEILRILSSSEEELERWRAEIHAAVGQNGELISNLIPELELIIGKQTPPPALARNEAENRFLTVFRAFLGVFAGQEHPLVLFLDDLQWADPASLRLLEHLLIHPDVRHLLLLGAYRDNEVSPSHPLTLALGGIRRSGAALREIVLDPLPFAEVAELLADTLHQERTRIDPLARLVYQKTAGNPYFLIQFLNILAEERLIEFSPHAAIWGWDLERIRGLRITDNVVDLVVGKLHRLPANTLDAVKQLACLGSSAEIVTLTTGLATSDERLHANLQPAVAEGFLLRLGSLYTFTHDRVQEAAYSLIPEASRTELHLRIGRRLIAKLSTEGNDAFDALSQINRGAALISDTSEKHRIAELNLQAARRARASTAYASACSYASAGIGLLDDHELTTRSEIGFGLSLLLAECEFLRGDFERSARLVDDLIGKAKAKADLAAAYCLKVDLHILKSEHTKAVETAQECLRRFDLRLPERPTAEDVRFEFEEVWRALGERSIESLINLPAITDPHIQAVMRVLSVLYSSAFSIDLDLFYLYICYTVKLTLRHGTSEASAHSYAYFGFILGPAFHRYADGYRFAKLGVDLVEASGITAYRAKVYLTIAWVALWTQPLSVACKFVRMAFRAAGQTGDLTYACYCCDWIVTDLLAEGTHLEEVWRESEKSLDFVRKARAHDYVDRILSHQWFVHNMLGRDGSLLVDDTQFNEAVFEARLSRDDKTILCWYWIQKLQARYILGDYQSALAAATKARPLLGSATGCLQLLDYHYYTSLTIASLFDRAPVDQQLAWRAALAEHLEQLREWADNYPPTFGDKHALVAAEIARLDGSELDAMHLYEQAITAARDNGFVHNEGVANEVTAGFYGGRGFEAIGQTYLRQARSCYQRWGASGKVKQFDQRHPGLGEQTLVGATQGALIEGLDLATAITALQAVSRDIDRESLIENLLATVVELAGAGRALLFLVRGAEYQLEAEALLENGHLRVGLLQNASELPAFPQSIVRYVARTQESVILDDASTSARFSHDDYVRATHPRSVLGLSLVKSRELIGVLYLENNLAPAAFRQERLGVLELLASQAAISLKNAQLFADLQSENSERKRAEEELRQSSAELSRLQEEMRLASRAVMMGELTASLAHELSQPQAAIQSNAQAARRLLAAKKPDLGEVRAAIEDIIQDNSRAIETIRGLRKLFQKDRVTMTAVDLHQLVNDVAHMVKGDALRRNIALRLQLPTSLPTVFGSRTQLVQALINLVLNAFDAIGEGEEGLREVAIQAGTHAAATVYIAVRDTGQGIRPELMSRLFETFFTTKPDGMGMGLAITRSIIESHGGSLWASNNPDRGATLQFELPAQADLQLDRLRSIARDPVK